MCFNLKLPKIKVRDKCTGEEFFIGHDIHDHLYIDENGALQYINVQGMSWTEYDDATYEFVPCFEDEDMLGKEFCDVEMVDVYEFVNQEVEERIKKLSKKCEYLRKKLKNVIGNELFFKLTKEEYDFLIDLLRHDELSHTNDVQFLLKKLDRQRYTKCGKEDQEHNATCVNMEE